MLCVLFHSRITLEIIVADDVLAKSVGKSCNVYVFSGCLAASVAPIARRLGGSGHSIRQRVIRSMLAFARESSGGVPQCP